MNSRQILEMTNTLKVRVYTVNGTIVAAFAERLDAENWISSRLYPRDYYVEQN